MTNKASLSLPEHLLTDAAGAESAAVLGDAAWIDVIQKMETIYTDLVRYQVELEQKNAELENTQRFVESVISSMFDVLVVCDVNGVIQQVNTALVDTLGVSAHDVVGAALPTLFMPESAQAVAQFPVRIREGGIVDEELELKHASEYGVPMALNCAPRFNHANRLSGMVLTGRPLGELRRAYDQLNEAHAQLKTTQMRLIQSEKMASLGRLVAGVAHELNNPISIIYGNMHVLARYEARFKEYIEGLRETTSPQAQSELYEKLNIDHMLQDIGPLIEGSMEGAERVTAIVQNLLRFSIPERRTAERFNLHKVCNTAMQWVLKSASTQIENELDVAEDLWLNNHEGYVHQILVNLIQNAVDAMEDVSTPRLIVRACFVDGGLSVTVQDNGHGIDEADFVKLFDPFFTRKDVGKGTGLGLYISYGLAKEQCGCDLRAENHADGGAVFTLFFPGDQI